MISSAVRKTLLYKGPSRKFPCHAAVSGSGIGAAVAQVGTTTRMPSLAWDLPHAAGEAKSKIRENKIK